MALAFHLNSKSFGLREKVCNVVMNLFVCWLNDGSYEHEVSEIRFVSYDHSLFVRYDSLGGDSHQRRNGRRSRLDFRQHEGRLA